LNLSDIYKCYNDYFQQSKLPFLLCHYCGHRFYYPRDKCPRCHKNELDVKQSSGLGKVYSFTIVRRKGSDVSCYAIVELEEGFRIYSNIEGKVVIGDTVRVFFKEKDGSRFPFFRAGEP